MLHAKSEQIRDGHRFVDPGLRRVTQSLDDLQLPPKLHDLTGQTWDELNKLAEPGGDTADAHATLDQLREAYVDLYAEAEAISRSSVVAAEQRVKRELKGGRAAAPAVVEERATWPTGSRTACAPSIPPGVRRGVRKALGRETVTVPAAGDRDLEPRGPHRLRHRLALDQARRAAARDHRRAAREERGAVAAVGAAAAAARVRRGAARRQRLRPTAPPRWRAETVAGVGARRQVHARRRTRSTSRAPAPSTWLSTSSRCTPSRTSTTGASPRSRPATPASGTATWCSPPRARSRSPTSAGRSGTSPSILRVPRHGLYLADDRHGYLDLGLRNAEEWGFPIGPDFVFTKAFEWEIRTTPDRRPLDRPAAGPVRGAQVPRRRRVRALDRPGVVRDVASATSASAASGRSSTPSRTVWCLPGSTTSSPPRASTSWTS